ncbi:MAG: diguanylate cyclase [Magnetococcales bacterium]|nr:diguanylate cyclase [Magnetococcales bacterium]
MNTKQPILAEHATGSNPSIEHMDDNGHHKLWRRFLLNISLVLLIFTLGAFVGMLSKHEQLITEELISRARAHFKDIVLTRRWNASYGGVYVEKKPGVVSNPYLKDPDITTTSGKTYTLKNPALMTREISELAKKDGDYQFHITSLKLRNPDNTPDLWEQQALLEFNTGIKEKSTILSADSKTMFRYMAPLYVEEKCLSCHQDQGYKVGDIRGGISVSFDITYIQKSSEQNRILLIIITVIIFALLIGIVYYIIANLYRKLDDALMKLREMATTDPLTGLFNRRYFFERLATEVNRHERYGHNLSCIFMDLDHFKKINDHYGHASGDEALRTVSQLLRTRCRSQDICARYGGEELVMLLPETPLEGAKKMAEDLCQQVAKVPIPTPNGSKFYLTASFGVASFSNAATQKDVTADDLLSQADKAVYQAKAQGRNRVVVVNP